MVMPSPLGLIRACSTPQLPWHTSRVQKKQHWQRHPSGHFSFWTAGSLVSLGGPSGTPGRMTFLQELPWQQRAGSMISGTIGTTGSDCSRGRKADKGGRGALRINMSALHVSPGCMRMQDALLGPEHFSANRQGSLIR